MSNVALACVALWLAAGCAPKRDMKGADELPAAAAPATPAPGHPPAPPETPSLTADEERALRDLGAKWLAAARRGDSETLASMAADPITIGRVQVNLACEALVKAPVPHDKMKDLARCLSDLFRSAPTGENRDLRRVAEDRVLGHWHLDIGCDGNEPQYVSLDLRRVDDDWRVVAVELIDECVNDP